MQKLLFIYNPRAGTGRVKGKLSDILDIFAKANFRITVRPTQGPGDAIQTAQKARWYDRVICCGGDGTLHEVITGLLQLTPDRRPPLGYIPAGTTNDFARNLHLPKTIEGMAAVAASGVPRPCDIGRLGDQHYFVYVAAFGAFTSVAYNTPQEFKNVFGHLAYVLQGVTELANLKSYHLNMEYDDGQVEGDFLYGMFCNTISVGGVIDLPQNLVALDDGLLEAVLIKMPESVQQFQNILLALTTQDYSEKNGVISLHSSQFRFTCSEPMPLTLDGEFGGEHIQGEIHAVHAPITIIYGE